jgi:hypothetical protein
MFPLLLLFFVEWLSYTGPMRPGHLPSRDPAFAASRARRQYPAAQPELRNTKRRVQLWRWRCSPAAKPPRTRATDTDILA